MSINHVNWKFQEKLDFETSPFTGMTRQHWLAAARFLADRVFSHVKSMDDPIVMPKQNKISYPQPNDEPWSFQSAEFEGLTRTLMVACRLIVEDPSAECNGINLRDYYARMILQAADPNSPRFLGRISDFTKEYGVY